MEAELASEFVKKYPNLFTEDKDWWTKEIETLLNNHKAKLKKDAGFKKTCGKECLHYMTACEDCSQEYYKFSSKQN